MVRGVWGPRVLVGRRFAGDKCVCWWEVVLLVKHCSAGETRFAGPNANSRPNAIFWPNAQCRPERELPPKRNLLARTQFAGTKNQVTEFFEGEGSGHDGAFPFPAALGGAAAYLFRWLASNTHCLGCSGDNHPLISLEGLRFGPSRTCPVPLYRSILSSGGIVAFVVLDYVSRAVYSYR